MDQYTIDPSGAWGFYHPMRVPKGWRMLGTIQCASNNITGALGRSPAGLYAQITTGSVRMLDQRAVAAALSQIELR